ncbi:MAG: hypothetical protein J2P19_21890, partial [Pseudonocardia sp.]|nr:hypothetical protein [Pseudonocardia sp.]
MSTAGWVVENLRAELVRTRAEVLRHQHRLDPNYGAALNRDFPQLPDDPATLAKRGPSWWNIFWAATDIVGDLLWTWLLRGRSRVDPANPGPFGSLVITATTEFEQWISPMLRDSEAGTRAPILFSRLRNNVYLLNTITWGQAQPPHHHREDEQSRPAMWIPIALGLWVRIASETLQALGLPAGVADALPLAIRLPSYHESAHVVPQFAYDTRNVHPLSADALIAEGLPGPLYEGLDRDNASHIAAERQAEALAMKRLEVFIEATYPLTEAQRKLVPDALRAAHNAHWLRRLRSNAHGQPTRRLPALDLGYLYYYPAETALSIVAFAGARHGQATGSDRRSNASTDGRSGLTGWSGLILAAGAAVLTLSGGHVEIVILAGAVVAPMVLGSRLRASRGSKPAAQSGGSAGSHANATGRAHQRPRVGLATSGKQIKIAVWVGVAALILAALVAVVVFFAPHLFDVSSAPLTSHAPAAGDAAMAGVFGWLSARNGPSDDSGDETHAEGGQAAGVGAAARRAWGHLHDASRALYQAQLAMVAGKENGGWRGRVVEHLNLVDGIVAAEGAGRAAGVVNAVWEAVREARGNLLNGLDAAQPKPHRDPPELVDALGLIEWAIRFTSWGDTEVAFILLREADSTLAEIEKRVFDENVALTLPNGLVPVPLLRRDLPTEPRPRTPEAAWPGGHMRALVEEHLAARQPTHTAATSEPSGDELGEIGDALGEFAAWLRPLAGVADELAAVKSLRWRAEAALERFLNPPLGRARDHGELDTAIQTLHETYVRASALRTVIIDHPALSTGLQIHAELRRLDEELRALSDQTDLFTARSARDRAWFLAAQRVDRAVTALGQQRWWHAARELEFAQEELSLYRDQVAEQRREKERVVAETRRLWSPQYEDPEIGRIVRIERTVNAFMKLFGDVARLLMTRSDFGSAVRIPADLSEQLREVETNLLISGVRTGRVDMAQVWKELDQAAQAISDADLLLVDSVPDPRVDPEKAFRLLKAAREQLDMAMGRLGKAPDLRNLRIYASAGRPLTLARELAEGLEIMLNSPRFVDAEGVRNIGFSISDFVVAAIKHAAQLADLGVGRQAAQWVGQALDLLSPDLHQEAHDSLSDLHNTLKTQFRTVQDMRAHVEATARNDPDQPAIAQQLRE